MSSGIRAMNDSGSAGSQHPSDELDIALDERDRAILDFEREWWRYGGAKEEAIRERFGTTATRHYQRLNAIIDLPEAVVADPVLVRRLQRLRRSRQEARTARRSA